MMILNFLFTGFFVLHSSASASASASATDCGYAIYRSSIENTTSIVIHSASIELPITITEIPKIGGTKECVRLEFNISKSGRAKNISIRENSRSFDMNVAALNALSKYKFRYIGAKKGMRFTLIFRATLGVAPEKTGVRVDFPQRAPRESAL